MLGKSDIEPEKGLVDFENAGCFDDRRFLLAVRKTSRTLPIDINPREFLSVVIVDDHLPVAMFAPPVVTESSCALLGFLSGFLLHRVS